MHNLPFVTETFKQCWSLGTFFSYRLGLFLTGQSLFFLPVASLGLFRLPVSSREPQPVSEKNLAGKKKDLGKQPAKKRTQPVRKKTPLGLPPQTGEKKDSSKELAQTLFGAVRANCPPSLLLIRQEARRKSLGKLFAQTVFNWVHWGGCFLGGGFSSPLTKQLVFVYLKAAVFLPLERARSRTSEHDSLVTPTI